MWNTITIIASESFSLLAQMAPYLLLGIVAAGLLHVMLPVDAVSKHLGKSNFGSVLRAALLGIPLPICSCGVVPVAASLKKEGASSGATVSFLVTTPTTGVDSILATYSLLGIPITIARVLSALVLGIVAGAAANLGFIDKVDIKTAPTSECGNEDHSKDKQNRLMKALRYALQDLLAGISRPLLIGIVLGGMVAFFMPQDFIEQYIGDGMLPYLLMMAIGIPLYVCASGSIPIAGALLLKGISPGAALVFLIAGPATNIATITVISSMLGKRTAAVYLLVLVFGSLAAGIATDAIFTLFSIQSVTTQIAAHVHETHLSILEIASGIFIGVLMLYYVIRPMIARLTRLFIPAENTLTYIVKGMS